MADEGLQVATVDHTEVDIKRLKIGLSPRIGEQDLDHARALAYRLDECPPILVERTTSTVIDGVHRLLAARLLGRSKVAVRFFDGTREEAFAEAVRSNIAHGKPLTLAEREAAVKKILEMKGEWSDRLVANICGLSDKTVGRLRKTTAEIPKLAERVGRDGRHRPTDSRQLRMQIAAALSEKPDASMVKLAQEFSTSPTTVRDVRKRIQSGEDPIPLGRSRTSLGNGHSPPNESNGHRSPAGEVVRWSADSALLALPGGVVFSGWLDVTKILSSHWKDHIADIPLSRFPQLIAEARSRAEEWTKFANSLEERARELTRRAER
jgi:ParB-like chromosome segregation protein Spo0J